MLRDGVGSFKLKPLLVQVQPLRRFHLLRQVLRVAHLVDRTGLVELCARIAFVGLSFHNSAFCGEKCLLFSLLRSSCVSRVARHRLQQFRTARHLTDFDERGIRDRDTELAQFEQLTERGHVLRRASSRRHQRHGVLAASDVVEHFAGLRYFVERDPLCLLRNTTRRDDVRTGIGVVGLHEVEDRSSEPLLGLVERSGSASLVASSRGAVRFQRARRHILASAVGRVLVDARDVHDHLGHLARHVVVAARH